MNAILFSRCQQRPAGEQRGEANQRVAWAHHACGQYAKGWESLAH